MAAKYGSGSDSFWGRARNQLAGRGVLPMLAGFLVTTLCVGCAGPSTPRTACVIFFASENLNLFDGDPHPLTVYVYPLSSSAGFKQINVENLLEGERPAGVIAPPVPITISPGEERQFQEMFPTGTSQLGILADYYREPADPEGRRTQVVPARCGLRKPKLVLSPKDVYQK